MSSPTSPSLPLPLRCVAQSYAWGCPGQMGAVGQLLSVSDDKPYAELWMGTHPSGPSTMDDGTQLSAQLGGPLPYLFKVLSVQSALSIQAHPDSGLAQRLHREKPNMYKDPMHKPELACAITPFEAMCGFRPLRQILDHAEAHAELADMLGSDVLAKLRAVAASKDSEDSSNGPEEKAVLKEAFAALMAPSAETLQRNLQGLLQRLRSEGVKPSVPSCLQQTDAAAAPSVLPPSSAPQSLDVPSLILRLSEQYPGDLGAFAPFVLNCFALRPGQAIFLGPNEPHAYLAGDCVECMAASDNVVRAGLTPKERDVSTLVEMLTYRSQTPAQAMMQHKTRGEHSIEYAPPKEFGEFKLLRTLLPASSPAPVSLPPMSGASILLVFDGELTLQLEGQEQGSKLTASKGQVLLVPDGAKLRATTTGGKEALLFQCGENKE